MPNKKASKTVRVVIAKVWAVVDPREPVTPDIAWSLYPSKRLARPWKLKHEVVVEATITYSLPKPR